MLLNLALDLLFLLGYTEGACPTLTPLGEEKLRNMTFSRHDELVSEIDLTEYLEPGCETLLADPPLKHHGCYIVPGGT